MSNGAVIGIFGMGIVTNVGSVRQVGQSRRVKVDLGAFPMTSIFDRDRDRPQLELRLVDSQEPPKVGTAIWISGGTYEVNRGQDGTRYHNLYAYAWSILHPERLSNATSAMPSTASSAVPTISMNDPTDTTQSTPAALVGEVPDGDDDSDIPWS